MYGMPGMMGPGMGRGGMMGPGMMGPGMMGPGMMGPGMMGPGSRMGMAPIRRYNVHMNMWDGQGTNNNQNFTNSVEQKIKEKNLWTSDLDEFYRSRGGD